MAQARKLAPLAARRGEDALLLAKAQGCRVYDADNVAYIDLLGGGGSNLLGYGNQYVLDAVRRASTTGLTSGFHATAELELVELLQELLPGLSPWVLAPSENAGLGAGAALVPARHGTPAPRRLRRQPPRRGRGVPRRRRRSGGHQPVAARRHPGRGRPPGARRPLGQRRGVRGADGRGRGRHRGRRPRPDGVAVRRAHARRRSSSRAFRSGRGRRAPAWCSTRRSPGSGWRAAAPPRCSASLRTSPSSAACSAAVCRAARGDHLAARPAGDARRRAGAAALADRRAGGDRDAVGAAQRRRSPAPRGARRPAPGRRRGARRAVPALPALLARRVDLLARLLPPADRRRQLLRPSSTRRRGRASSATPATAACSCRRARRRLAFLSHAHGVKDVELVISTMEAALKRMQKEDEA